MVQILGLLGMLIGIGSLICWILVIVAAFKNEDSPLLGILCIVLCGLGAFVIGWIKNKDWGIQQLMMIWSGLVIAGIVINVAVMAMAPAALPQ